MSTLEKMTEAVTVLGENLTLVGDCLLVERLPKREVKVGSIVMASSLQKQITGFDSNQPEFVRVLAVGKGYYDEETKQDVALDLKPGNIIELGKNSIVWFSSFGTILDNQKDGTGVGLARAGDYRMKFTNYADYEIFMGFFGG